jgi:predicted TIM-barrel fold metal-dependent hydrolase
MFGSDYPHPARTWPHSRQIIEEQMQCLPPAVLQRITRDNARDLFGI